jgi:signal transduction histidine kinase
MAKCALQLKILGLPQEDMDRIFETFFTTKSEGMGMGFSICRSIVASHGGRITVAKGVAARVGVPADFAR